MHLKRTSQFIPLNAKQITYAFKACNLSIYSAHICKYIFKKKLKHVRTTGGINQIKQIKQIIMEMKKRPTKI